MMLAMFRDLRRGWPGSIFEYAMGNLLGKFQFLMSKSSRMFVLMGM